MIMMNTAKKSPTSFVSCSKGVETKHYYEREVKDLSLLSKGRANGFAVFFASRTLLVESLVGDPVRYRGVELEGDTGGLR